MITVWGLKSKIDRLVILLFIARAVFLRVFFGGGVEGGSISGVYADWLVCRKHYLLLDEVQLGR